jgi:hypothetical protein
MSAVYENLEPEAKEELSWINLANFRDSKVAVRDMTFDITKKKRYKITRESAGTILPQVIWRLAVGQLDPKRAILQFHV